MVSLQKQYKRAGEEYAQIQKTAGMDQAEEVPADPKKNDGDAEVSGHGGLALLPGSWY